MTAAACPKAMTYGPCGGVQPDGACEIAPTRCAFVDRPLVRWPHQPVEVRTHVGGGDAMLAQARAGTLVVAGLSTPPMDAAALRRSARILGPVADAVLMGDFGGERVQFPPSYRAAIVQQEGLLAWPGLSCRDRNRVALEGELAALADIGVGGVHCVTGDHTASGHRPDATPVFDLDATELVAHAHGLGLATSVAESPAAPPVALRGQRVANKVRAGADLCMLQYCGEIADVAAFAAQVRAAGSDIPLLPGVPVITHRAGAELLASFAAAVLPAGYVEAVLTAHEPERAGIEIAISYGRALLEVDGVGGVVLAGGRGPAGSEAFARALATVAAELR